MTESEGGWLVVHLEGEKRTIAAMLLSQLADLAVRQARGIVNLEVRKHLLG